MSRRLPLLLALVLPTLSLSLVPVSRQLRSRSRSTQSFLRLSKASKEEEDSAHQLSRIEAVRKLLNQEKAAEEKDFERRDLVINVVAGGLLAVIGVALAQLFKTNVYSPSGFQRLPETQFIAALADPKASSGTITAPWGLWRKDPGPRGVWLRDFDTLQSSKNVAPVGWKFDNNDWWLEEHGIIMEQPKFPLAPGRYLVTGGRLVTTGLTVDKTGSWKLDEGCLYDVTHLPCRSARYTPIRNDASPRNARLRDFPVVPGAEMPQVDGYTKQDYAVLFVVGKAIQ